MKNKFINKQAGLGTTYITEYKPKKNLSIDQQLDAIRTLQDNSKLSTALGAGLGGGGGYALGYLLNKYYGNPQGSSSAAMGAALTIPGAAIGGLLGHYLNKYRNVSKLEDKHKADVPLSSLFNRDVLLAALAKNDDKELERVSTASSEKMKKELLDKFRYGVTYTI